MLRARYNHTATLLPNGKVLVTGGFNGSENQLAFAELYDPATGKWTTTNALRLSRERHTATLLNDGRVLVIGGQTGDINAPITDAEIYTPATGAWHDVGKLSAAREKHTATLLPDGRVLVTGGRGAGGAVLSSAEIFTLSGNNGSWTSVGAMGVSRMRHTATLLPNNTVLVVGGCAGAVTATSPCSTSHGTADLFTIGSSAWSAASPLPTGASARYDHTATLLPSGQVMILGGQQATDSVNHPSLATAAIYDPTHGWSPAFGMMNLTSKITSARYGYTATLLASGKVLFVGGFNSGGYGDPTPGGSQLLWDEIVYDPGKYDPAGSGWSGGHWHDGSFSAANALPGAARYQHTATLLPNGKVLVAGGSDLHNNALTSTALYDPATGAWTKTGNLNTARYSHTATLLRTGEVLVAGGNISENGYSSAVEILNPKSCQWRVTGSLATARARHTATLLPNGRVLVAGGFNNTVVGNALDTAERFDLNTESWSAAGKIIARWAHTATLLPNGKVLIAGGRGSSVLNSSQLYDPTGNSWAAAGAMAIHRFGHSATLLMTGEVLIVGGSNTSDPLATAEIYSPHVNKWMTTAYTTDASGKATPTTGQALVGNLSTSRHGHTATLLPDSRVLIAGGFGNEGRLSKTEIYDRGRGYADNWRPVVTNTGVPLVSGGKVAVTGTRFKGIAEAGGGNGAQNGATNHPLLLLQSLGNEQARFLPLDPAAGWSNTTFTSLPVTDFPAGYALATIITNGIPSVSRMLTAQADNTAGATTWYFAEGYTGAGFHEYLTIQNPNTSPATVRITYYLNGGAPVIKQFTVPARSRDTVIVHEAARGVGPGKEVSALVESTNGVGIVVERPMYFTYNGTIKGGHNVMGVNAPRQSWLFAEGYTGTGFDEYLTIMNPNPTAAPVTITYYRNGAAPVVKHLTVPGSSRYTVVVHDTKEGVGRGQEVSAKVETSHTGGIVVERPMYFAYKGAWRGGHNVMGAAATRATWHFPDGNTKTGNDEYLTLMNPGGTDAQVTLTYYLGPGTTQTRTTTVPKHSRATVLVHEASAGVGVGQTPAVTVESANGVGLVVERPMYNASGGDNVMGAADPRLTWLFAEGYTGTGFSQSLVILNPNDTAAKVTLTYYLNGAGTVQKEITVNGKSRRVVNVGGTSEGVGAGKEVSAKVETSHAGGIVVERPMTFTYGGSTPGSHTVMGYAP